MKAKAWVLGLLMAAAAAHAADPKPQHLRLEVGAMDTIEAQDSSDITVSKRGIIDIFPLGDGRWRLTGLRPGFVILGWQGENGDEMGRVHVEVLKPTPLAAVTEEKDAGLPAKLCALPHIICNHVEDRVSGLAPTFPLWLKARRLCLENHNCQFAVELGAAERDKLRLWLADVLGEDFNVTMAANGAPVVEGHCPDGKADEPRSWVNEVVQGSFAEDELLFRCRGGPAGENYQLNFRVVLLDNQAAEELGVQPGIDGKPVATLPLSAKELMLRISSLASNRNAKIVGEPMLQVTPGYESRIHSGGEFQVHYARKQEAWKTIGLEIKAILTDVRPGHGRLRFHLDLKNRSGEETSLLANALASEINLPFATLILAGTSDLAVDLKEASSDFSLARIPILGPLFRTRREQRGKTRLFVWAYLERAHVGTEQPPVPWPSL